ncbi:MAG: ORC1-type DNA replication protein [Nanoarchaeota archaeon]|nr:ORC1-type DNA replication protein [Nanoarchaeota archaeon]
MIKDNSNSFFDDYLKKEPLFVDKKVLQANYTPETIPHREELIQTISSILAPALRNEKPSNLFLYGKTGTGKTLSVKHVINNLNEISERKKIPLKIFYLNCKLRRVADTEYRMIAQLARELGENIPSTGLPTDEVYRKFLEILDKEERIVIIVLDEIDQLIKKAGDELLYNLTRLNTELKNANITIVGISNDLMFTDNIDPRVKSSLSEEELVFPPYNAIQLQDILRERSKRAFRKETVGEGVIEKCAAYAAREHGDARRALELLRVAGELAERKNKTKLDIDHIDEAEEKIEKDRVLDIVHTQPKQFQVTLLAIFSTLKKNEKLFTGDVYEVYKDICIKSGLRPLTQRRVSDIIAELDMLGIINARVISKGRYGRTREIKLAIPSSTMPSLSQVLKDGLGL